MNPGESQVGIDNNRYVGLMLSQDVDPSFFLGYTDGWCSKPFSGHPLIGTPRALMLESLHKLFFMFFLDVIFALSHVRLLTMIQQVIFLFDMATTWTKIGVPGYP